MKTLDDQEDEIQTGQDGEDQAVLISPKIKHYVIKRNGVRVSYDKNKIVHAIKRAFEDVDPDFLRQETSKATSLIEGIATNVDLSVCTTSGTIDIETIQDSVERSLMHFGHLCPICFEVAKSYILYRAKRASERDLKNEKARHNLSKSSINIVVSESHKCRTDSDEFMEAIINAAKGHEDIVDILDLAHQAESSMFDGITWKEARKAIVMAARGFIERDPEWSKVAARALLDYCYEETIGMPSYAPGFYQAYAKSFVGGIQSLVHSSGRLSTEMVTSYDLEALASVLVPSRDFIFEYMGVETLYGRYLMKDNDKKRVESPQGFWMRVAMGLALGEKPEDRMRMAIEFYHVLSEMLYVPSTPTLFHAGAKRAQLSSCYLNHVSDDLKDIFKTYSDNAQMAKYSGGIGTDWTPVRSMGATVNSINIESQGTIPYLKIANDVIVAINRSGNRRGAGVAYLETWHLDILDFLELRRNVGDDRRRCHDMSTANWIPDLFMERVAKDGVWTLFSPDEVPDLHDLYGEKFKERYEHYEFLASSGSIKHFKHIQAKDLWKKMLGMIFETGHPWMTWKDAFNVRNPQDHCGVIHNTNLCTEIGLNNSKEEIAVCNIGSLNLARMPMDGNDICTESMANVIKLAIRMLDNVIDINFYPIPEAENSNKRHRPIGLGIMGWQDYLYRVKTSFASEGNVKESDRVQEFISLHAILASAELAKERGAYETYKGSKWYRGIFPLDTIKLLAMERNSTIEVDLSSHFDWTEVRKAVWDFGMRNSNVMAIAPTATISTIVGTVPCTEPVYENIFVETNMSGQFVVINSYLVNALKSLNLWNEDMLSQIKMLNGSVQEIKEIPDEVKSLFLQAFEIEPIWVVKAAAARGKWIDQSQSLNIFFGSPSGKKLSDIYFAAWRSGLKSTYYLRCRGASSNEKVTSAKIQESVLSESSAKEVDLTALKVCSIDNPDCESCQ